jgi:ribosomal protein S16
MNNQSYVYLATPNGDGTYIYTVGFYMPDASWYAVSDHSEEEAAAERVHYLNGGEQLAKVKAILSSTETELRGANLLIAKLKGQVSTLECALEAEIQRLTEQLADAGARAEQELENRYAKEYRQTERCPFCGSAG